MHIVAKPAHNQIRQKAEVMAVLKPVVGVMLPYLKSKSVQWRSCKLSQKQEYIAEVDVSEGTSKTRKD